MLQLSFIHLKTSFKYEYAMDFLKELWMFLRIRKKLWMAPIVLLMVIFGGLLVLTQGSVVAPFIYTLF